MNVGQAIASDFAKHKRLSINPSQTEDAMTESALDRWKWAHCFVFGALLGSIVGCAGNEPELPDVPRAGPILTIATHRIAKSEAFVAFADSVSLDTTQRIRLARTLALHFKNEESIQVTAKRPEQLNAAHRQLLGDTVAHLRTQIPESAWDAFTRSGLLPEVASVGMSDGRSR